MSKRMNVESTVQKICNCLDALLCEANSEIEAKIKVCSDREAIHQELRRKIHITLEKIEIYPEIKGIVIKFVQTCYGLGKKCFCDHLTFLQMCLVLLRLLQKALSQEEADSCSSKNHAGCKMFMPRGLLSISQQQVLKKCFQFIVGLGILPNLLRGIGIPLNRRLQNANIFENFITDSTCYQKHVQLVICLEALLDCLNCEAMHSILFSYHGTDLFATLLQLCHAPIKKIEKSLMTAAKTTSSDKIEFRSMLAAIRDKTNHSECEIVSLMLLHRNHFTHRLEKFLNQINPTLLIWELILFQGIPMRSDHLDLALTRCPVWMRKICNQMLTDLILQSHGIVSLVQAVLDKAFDLDVETGKVDSSQMEAVAHLITLNCVRHLSLENYMQRLSKQVFQLLHLKGSQMNSFLKCIASCIILQFYARDQQLGENCFFKKILEPLWMCVLKYDNSESEVIVNEKDLTTCIEDLYQIFVSCTLPLKRSCIKILFPLFHCLSMLYFFLVKSSSFLRSKVKEILVEILYSATNEEALGLLYVVTIPNCQYLDVHQTTVSFANGDEGGVIAMLKEENDDISEKTSCYPSLVDLIRELGNKKLNNLYILLIIKEHCSFLLEVKELPFDTCNLRVYNAFNVLLQELSEGNADLKEALTSNISEVTELLLTLLESICNGKTDAPFYQESAISAVMILTSLFSNKLTSNDWQCLQKCIPSLQKLKKCDIDPCLKDLLLQFLIPIATRGVADSEEVREYMKRYTVAEHVCASEDCESGNSSLEDPAINGSRQFSFDVLNTLDELESQLSNKLSNAQIGEEVPNCFSKSSAKSFKKDSPKKFRSEFELAMGESKNAEIPICGHGLLHLSNLVEQKDEEALRNRIEVFKLFLEKLRDEDSYVYLNAIKGILSLAVVDTELVLQNVLKIYQDEDEKCLDRLKMGEVIMKICRLLGSMLYKYRDQILHIALIGTKHSDPRIRSSCLSIIGEVCASKDCNISGQWLQEILMCVLSLLKTDQDLEVRRCAVMVITLLIKGPGKNMIQVLGNEIRVLYKQLKLVFHTEIDEVLHRHAREALEAIDSAMTDILSTPLPLTKEIRILP